MTTNLPAADVIKGLSYTVGVVPGPYRNEPMVCQNPHLANTQGSLWMGHNPFAYTTPVLFMQFILIFFISRTVYYFLKPLRQSIMFSQIISGIILGPTFLARNGNFKKSLFPLGGKAILGTAADVGMVINLFLIGVQTDVTFLRKAGRNSIIIGVSGFVAAYGIALGAVTVYSRMFTLQTTVKEVLPFLIASGSITSFPVITSLLADLNILNSELGHLASFVAMVSDCMSLFFSIIVGHLVNAMLKGDWTELWSIFWSLCYLGGTAFLCRPLIKSIAKRIPEGKHMGEDQLIPILIIVLFFAFWSEYLGYHSALGAFVVGLALPDGPPLAEDLIHKFEVMSTGIFLPAKFGITGLNIRILAITRTTETLVAELVIVCGYFGKFFGTVISGLFCGMPFKEAISIGLVMCCKGIVDVALFCLWKDTGMVGDIEYTLLILTMLLVTGVARPLVSYLYDPSRRYMVHVRSSLLQYNRRNVQPRILVAIHREENVTTTLKVLEASNPTKSSRLSVFVLNLKELKGRSTSVLVPNFKRGRLASTLKHSEHIVNAFAYYEEHHSQGNVLLQHFTAIAPYASMHDDICNLALDKRVTIVILPFHKQWDIDGTVGEVFPSIRAVNLNVLSKCPCTVGVLVDRERIGRSSWTPLMEKSLFRVALLFLGGTDDREAFAYASRMADHPHVTLKVIWIRPGGKRKTDAEMEDPVDVELMEDFKAKSKGNERVIFQEEFVEDVVGTTKVIHSIEDTGFDLFVVGRYHDPSSSLVLGMTEWSDCPELGAIGDMLATSDVTFSILVIQQEPLLMGDPYMDHNYQDTKVHPEATDGDHKLPYE